MLINFVAKVIDNGKNTLDGYVMKLDLPFAPAVGMKLKSSAGESLWETVDGNELNPQIKETVYNIDDGQLYCLFEINRALSGSRWTRIEDPQGSNELCQFEDRRPEAKVPEEDLEPLMREVLPIFISDKRYISRIEKTHDRNHVRRIKLAIAQCIDNKYTTNYRYITTVNGDIVFAHFGLESSELTASGEKFLSGA